MKKENFIKFIIKKNLKISQKTLVKSVTFFKQLERCFNFKIEKQFYLLWQPMKGDYF